MILKFKILAVTISGKLASNVFVVKQGLILFRFIILSKLINMICQSRNEHVIIWCYFAGLPQHERQHPGTTWRRSIKWARFARRSYQTSLMKPWSLRGCQKAGWSTWEGCCQGWRIRVKTACIWIFIRLCKVKHKKHSYSQTLGNLNCNIKTFFSIFKFEIVSYENKTRCR